MGAKGGSEKNTRQATRRGRGDNTPGTYASNLALHSDRRTEEIAKAPPEKEIQGTSHGGTGGNRRSTERKEAKKQKARIAPRENSCQSAPEDKAAEDGDDRQKIEQKKRGGDEI